MYINTKVYDALIGAHMREIAAMEQTIKRMDTIIEALRRENQNLENRLAYNKAKAMEHLAKKKPAKPYQKPAIKAEDNREELRTDNRDEDNHYHKMPEE